MKTNQLNVCKGEVAATGKFCVSKHNSKKRMRHQEITGFHCLEQTPGKHKALTKAVCVHGTKPWHTFCGDAVSERSSPWLKMTAEGNNGLRAIGAVGFSVSTITKKKWWE